jgi:thiamine-monophosphate kinase
VNIENHFIQLMSKNKTPIGDDGAVVGKWIYSKDLFFENVHFKREWLTPYQIATKAMLVNISDAIAMNAIPVYALLGVAMPKSMSLHDRKELSRGFLECAQEFGIEIIGGDTIGNTKLDISVTIVSKSRHPLLRKGLKPNDIIAHTGNLGQSLRQLRFLMARGCVHSQSRFIKPNLRQKFIAQSVRYLRCGMDISDGLFSDTQKLCSANRLDIRWDKKLPKNIGCSGEEYEMLVAFDPRNLQKIKRLAHLTRTPLNIIGSAVRGTAKNRCKAHHF